MNWLLDLLGFGKAVPAPAPRAAELAPAPRPAAPPPAPAMAASDAISDAALNLIVTEEVSGAAYYARHYTHFEWPAGASGPTIGIGYDCGYVTPAQARVDWDAFVGQGTIDAIVLACGLRGAVAQQFVRQSGGSVTVTWDQAIAQFRAREIPQWVAKVRARLPNFDELRPDCRGALVSVTYNRGVSFDLPGPRYAEMRSIKAHMAAKNFAAIPGDILSMQRLWPKGGDLWKRRAHEAALFQEGLQ